MRSSAIALVFLLSSAPAFAQNPPTPPKDPQKPPAAVGEEEKKPTRSFGSALIHNLGDDIKHLPRQNSVYWLAGGSALALAVHPLDDDVNRHFAGSGTKDSLWKPGQVVGNSLFILGAGGGSYLLGRLNKSDRLQHLGMDEIEAQLLAEGIVFGIKESVRRPRPERKNQTTGFSFPSGHAASTFAAATVLQQHLGYKAGVPTYLIASYVAMSRLHENVHNASDVVFGAAVGIIIGRSVTWHGRNFYGRSFTMMPMFLPGGAGVMVTINNRPPVSGS